MIEESSYEQYKIGGRDACSLMTGNWIRLYRRKREIKKSNSNNTHANLRSISSRIGMATEGENLNILQYEIEEEIYPDVSVDEREDFPWMCSQLDGMTHDTHTPCEAKHTYEGNSFENVLRKCYPQLQHYLLHTSREKIYLSVLFGTRGYVYASIPVDFKYQKRLLAAEEWFYQCLCDNKIPHNIGNQFRNIDINTKEIEIKSPYGWNA